MRSFVARGAGIAAVVDDTRRFSYRDYSRNTGKLLKLRMIASHISPGVDSSTAIPATHMQLILANVVIEM